MHEGRVLSTQSRVTPLFGLAAESWEGGDPIVYFFVWVEKRREKGRGVYNFIHFLCFVYLKCEAELQSIERKTRAPLVIKKGGKYRLAN